MSTGETRAYEALTAALKRTRQTVWSSPGGACRAPRQAAIICIEKGKRRRRLDVIGLLTIAQKMEADFVALLREAGLLR